MSIGSEISLDKCSLDFSKPSSSSSVDSVTNPQAIVSVVSKWDKAISRCTLVLVMLAYLYFWVYFGFAVAGSRAFENFAFTLLGFLLFCDQLFHIWMQFVFPRMSKLGQSLKSTDYRIAMIVTKAPSEPHDLLVHTLKCMLDQDYAGKYDVWIADERPSAEMEAFCAENGVQISCRFGIEEYHQKDWPRRTRCKEGNLAYFYDKYGYDNYDIVFQFDSDHAPTRNYLSSAIAGFTADPSVGYMAFPSINGTNKSWIGRGRTWFEAHYYGPYLSSFSYNPNNDESFLMPNCTGSHYAVRTSALKAIGGLGPELDEDLSTTIMFMSRGYKGVYSMDTIALGHGPENFEAAMVQEFQWARSAIILFFRWYKVLIPNHKYFTFGLWMRAFTTLYYYLSLGLLVCWVLAGAVLSYYVDWCTDPTKPCYFSILNFMLRTMPAVLIAYGHFLMCRKRGWLRAGRLEDPPPSIFTSPVIWIYRVLRTLWMSRGVLAGFQQLIFNKTPQFKVTPKGDNGIPVLSLSTLSPLYTILLLLGGAFWLPFIWKEPAEMGIALYMFICAVGCCIILAVIVMMHFWENGQASVRNTLSHVLMLAVCIGGMVATAVLQSGVIFNAATANLFVLYQVFPHEWILMIVFYGISLLHIFLSAFVA